MIAQGVHAVTRRHRAPCARGGHGVAESHRRHPRPGRARPFGTVAATTAEAVPVPPAPTTHRSRRVASNGTGASASAWRGRADAPTAAIAPHGRPGIGHEGTGKARRGLSRAGMPRIPAGGCKTEDIRRFGTAGNVTVRARIAAQRPASRRAVPQQRRTATTRQGRSPIHLIACPRKAIREFSLERVFGATFRNQLPLSS